MPSYHVHLINAEFASSEEREYPSLEAARKIAVASAMRIASESVADGHPSSAVEIRIEENGRTVSHQVVNLSVSQLLVGD